MRIAFLLAATLLTGCMAQPQKTERPTDVALAVETVKAYASLISQRKYKDAYRFWGNDGGDTRGTADDFAKSFEPYSSYVAEVGEPTEVKTSAGQEYINVTTKVRVTLKQSSAAFERSGPVMLRRPAGSRGRWQIWGTDIRARN